MKIECLTTFLHERDRFEKGDVRTVSDELGHYFIANGWAREPDGAAVPTATDAVTLDVHSGVIGTGDHHG